MTFSNCITKRRQDVYRDEPPIGGSQTRRKAMSSELMECPKCNKQTLIQYQSDLYQCLSCDFELDFSQPIEEDYPEEDDSGSGILAFFVVVFTIFALI